MSQERGLPQEPWAMAGCSLNELRGCRGKLLALLTGGGKTHWARETRPEALKRKSSFSNLAARVEVVAEKVFPEREFLPQRLKPHSKQCTYRSAKALRHPKSRAKPSFSANSERRALPNFGL